MLVTLPEAILIHSRTHTQQPEMVMIPNVGLGQMLDKYPLVLCRFCFVPLALSHSTPTPIIML